MQGLREACVLVYGLKQAQEGLPLSLCHRVKDCLWVFTRTNRLPAEDD